MPPIRLTPFAHGFQPTMKDFTDSADLTKSESNALSEVEGRGISKPMVFTVYILRSSSNQLYIGQTNNLNTRAKQHTTKDWKAAKFTKDGEDFRLVYQEEYQTRVKAMRRETQLKKWTRAKKEALIAGNKDKLKLLSKSEESKKTS